MRCVFVGTGDFLGCVHGETRYALRVEELLDRGFDPAQPITVVRSLAQLSGK